MAKNMIGLDPEDRVTVHRFPRVKSTFLGQLLEDLIDEEDVQSQELIQLHPIVMAWIAAARLPSGSAIALMPWSLDVR
jgi:hypothetical protein